MRPWNALFLTAMACSTPPGASVPPPLTPSMTPWDWTDEHVAFVAADCMGGEDGWVPRGSLDWLLQPPDSLPIAKAGEPPPPAPWPKIRLDLPEASAARLRQWERIYRDWDVMDPAMDRPKRPRSPEVCGRLVIDGEALQDVVVSMRGKLGNSFRSLETRPYFKIVVASPGHDGKAGSKRRLLDGLDVFRLYNHGQDVSRVQRYVGYWMMHDESLNAAPYPGPRAGFAEFSLKLGDASVRPLGLYGVNEEVALSLLTQLEGSLIADSTGNLYEGEYGQDFRMAPCEEDAVEEHCYQELEAQEGPALDDEAREYSDLAELVTKLVDAEDDGRFCAELETRIPRFLEFFALETLVGAREGYSYLTNNYYLYNDNDQGAGFVMLPFGFDQVLFDEKSPWDAEGWLAEAAISQCPDKVDAALLDAWTAMDWDAVSDTVNNLQALLGDEHKSFPDTRSKSVEVRAMRRDVLSFLDNKRDNLPTTEPCVPLP